jgi:hypothetical protein
VSIDPIHPLDQIDPIHPLDQIDRSTRSTRGVS